MTAITINAKNRSIELTKTFAAASSKFGTPEYDQLQQVRKDYAHLQRVRKDYPNYSVIQRQIKRNSNKKTNNGLTYEYMEDYIMTHGSAETIKNLHMLLDMATEGDTIITLEVSRLSRSTQQLCEIIDTIREKHLRLVIVGSITIDCRNGQIDPMSEAFLQMAGVFSQLELAMIRSRVRSGMENARAKGKQIGRRPTTKDDIPAMFYKHYPSYVAGNMNVSELARVCGLSRPTVYKYLKMLG